MSCSWEDLYLVNNTRIRIEESNCDKNVPIIVLLLPCQSNQVLLKLHIPTSMNTKNLTIKTGFNLIEIVKGQTIAKVLQSEMKKNSIWSNTISIE